MKTSVDVLVGLLAIKELELKTKSERITYLEEIVINLQNENNTLYTILEKEKEEQHVGFKIKGGRNEKEE